MDNSAAQHTSKMRIEKHSGVKWYNACHICAYSPVEVLVEAQPKNVIIISPFPISNPKIQSQYFTAILT